MLREKRVGYLRAVLLMHLLVAAAAEPALVLPPGEAAAAWAGPAALAGLRIGPGGAGPEIEVVHDAAGWGLLVRDGRGTVRRLAIAPPVSPQAREDAVWLGTSLLGQLPSVPAQEPGATGPPSGGTDPPVRGGERSATGAVGAVGARAEPRSPSRAAAPSTRPTGVAPERADGDGAATRGAGAGAYATPGDPAPRKAAEADDSPEDAAPGDEVRTDAVSADARPADIVPTESAPAETVAAGATPGTPVPESVAAGGAPGALVPESVAAGGAPGTPVTASVAAGVAPGTLVPESVTAGGAPGALVPESVAAGAAPGALVPESVAAAAAPGTPVPASVPAGGAPGTPVTESVAAGAAPGVPPPTKPVPARRVVADRSASGPAPPDPAPPDPAPPTASPAEPAPTASPEAPRRAALQPWVSLGPTLDVRRDVTAGVGGLLDLGLRLGDATWAGAEATWLAPRRLLSVDDAAVSTTVDLAAGLWWCPPRRVAPVAGALVGVSSRRYDQGDRQVGTLVVPVAKLEAGAALSPDGPLSVVATARGALDAATILVVYGARDPAPLPAWSVGASLTLRAKIPRSFRAAEPS